jgi:secondary thiamine-phosphate synthase enzyme
MVRTHSHSVHTSGQGDAHDITNAVGRAIAESGIRHGVATVFVVGSTAGVTTIEFESGALHDLNRCFETLAPRDGKYQRHLKWGDDNGSSHVRAAMLGPSVSVPFTDRKLALGTWQQIALLEFDTQPRHRNVVIQIIGDA